MRGVMAIAYARPDQCLNVIIISSTHPARTHVAFDSNLINIIAVVNISPNSIVGSCSIDAGMTSLKSCLRERTNNCQPPMYSCLTAWWRFELSSRLIFSWRVVVELSLFLFSLPPKAVSQNGKSLLPWWKNWLRVVFCFFSAPFINNPTFIQEHMVPIMNPKSLRRLRPLDNDVFGAFLWHIRRCGRNRIGKVKKVFFFFVE